MFIVSESHLLSLLRQKDVESLVGKCTTFVSKEMKIIQLFEYALAPSALSIAAEVLIQDGDSYRHVGFVKRDDGLWIDSHGAVGDLYQLIPAELNQFVLFEVVDIGVIAVKESSDA